MLPIIGSKTNIIVNIGARRSGKTRLCLQQFHQFATSPGGAIYITATPSMLYEAQKNLSHFIGSYSHGSMNISDMKAATPSIFHGLAPPQFLILDEFFMYDLDFRKSLYSWLSGTTSNVNLIFIAATPTKIYKKVQLDNVRKIKKTGHNFKSITKQGLEDLYYNFITEPKATIDRNRLYKPVDIQLIKNLSFHSNETMLMEGLGVYEKE